MVTWTGTCCSKLWHMVAMEELGLALACAGSGSPALSLTWGTPDGCRGMWVSYWTRLQVKGRGSVMVAYVRGSSACTWWPGLFWYSAGVLGVYGYVQRLLGSVARVNDKARADGHVCV